MKPEQASVVIRLHCIDFPGRSFNGKTAIKVGAQKGDAVVDDVFGDVQAADFDFELRVERSSRTGRPNFLGPYAHGTPAERFLYLCWGERIEGFWHGFRRAKIHLRDLDWATVERALASKRPIEAIVKLTDRKGEPLCASVQREHITWQL